MWGKCLSKSYYLSDIDSHKTRNGNNFPQSDIEHLWTTYRVALVVKNPPANAGDLRDVGLIPGWGRSPGEGKATHSSILACRIPWKEEPGGLQSMGSQRVRHD